MMNQSFPLLNIAGTQADETSITIPQKLCTMQGFLYGGAGLGLSIEMLEREFNRSTVWATTQFVSQVKPGEKLDCEITEENRGNNFSQTLINIQANSKTVFMTTATLTQKKGELEANLNPAPEQVPAPDSCERVVLHKGEASSIGSLFDIRYVSGPRVFNILIDKSRAPSNEKALFWVRTPGQQVTRSMLAIYGDMAPSAIGGMLGKFISGRSLDNSIRFNRMVETEWVLGEIEVHAIHNDIAHTTQRMWSENGELLAVSTQSCICKEIDEEFIKQFFKKQNNA